MTFLLAIVFARRPRGALAVAAVAAAAGCTSAPSYGTFIPIRSSEGARWVSAETMESYGCETSALVCSAMVATCRSRPTADAAPSRERSLEPEDALVRLGPLHALPRNIPPRSSPTAGRYQSGRGNR